MIALLGALKEEISCLRKRMTVTEAVSDDAYTLFRGTWKGREILLAQTGLGKQRAQAATRRLIDRYPITTLISLGFAGALTDELRAGDVVVYSSVHCVNVEACQQDVYLASDGLLARVKGSLKPSAANIFRKPGVTVPHAVLSPDEKDTLADAFDASVVDMESYWIAEIAAEKQIPCVVIRSVSDTKYETLLPFEGMMTEDGDVLWRPAACYFLRRPHHLVVVGRLAKNARVATRNLATAMDSLIAEL